MGGDVEGALEAISVPSYVLDSSGVVRWLNPAAERLLGDVRGRHYTSVVAPEETRRARELFTQKVLGTVEVTDSPATLLNTDGSRVDVEISSVPLRSGGHIIGGSVSAPTCPTNRRQRRFLGLRRGSTRFCGCSSAGTRPSRSQPSSTSAGTPCETMWPTFCAHSAPSRASRRSLSPSGANPAAPGARRGPRRRSGSARRARACESDPPWRLSDCAAPPPAAARCPRERA